MDVNVVLDISAEGMHHVHDTRQIALSGIPVFEGLIDRYVEVIVIGFFADAEIFPELLRRTEDHMLVLAVGKQRRVPLNPDIRLGNSAFRAKSRLTGVGYFFLILTIRALILMEPHFLSSALEHLLNVFMNRGAYLS
jgi:hypothetical protein